MHEAARLHALAPLPILLAGKGTGDAPYEAESEKMAWMLRTEHGIAPRWVETRSVNTHENALESWCLLAPQGFRRVVLVTHAAHMRRAGREFAWAGFEVVRDPIPDAPEPALEGEDFVPGRAGLVKVRRALSDYLEMAFTVVEDAASGVQCGTGALPG